MFWLSLGIGILIGLLIGAFAIAGFTMWFLFSCNKETSKEHI